MNDHDYLGFGNDKFVPNSYILWNDPLNFFTDERFCKIQSNDNLDELE